MNIKANERPVWLKQRIPARRNVTMVTGLLENTGLHTVCQSAQCPNIGECFGNCTATFLLLGNICTRYCRFCAVPKGSPLPPDQDEPDKLARAVVELALKHAVITSVTRDDLPDGGAGQFAACIEKVRELSPDITVEVLVPDFNGNRDALSKVLEARADVFNHNIETVPRLYTAVRPGASYRRSLTMLGAAAQAECSMVKSGIMVGLGETAEEVAAVFTDLVAAGVAAVTVGQYLSPSPQHLPVTEYIHPNQFRRYEELAYAAGFRQVASGPLVRSSYHAAQMIALDT